MSLLQRIANRWRATSTDAAPIGVTAAAIYTLMVDPTQWIHRRVEFIEFLSDRAVRRHVSLDFTVPADLGGLAVDERVLPFVPLTLLRKEPLRNFDLDDGVGDAVPILTKHDNERYLGESLVGVAETVLDAPLAPDLDSLLRAIVGAKEADAFRLLAAGPDEARARDQYERLLQSEQFMAYALALASYFVLLAILSPRPGKRQLAKLGFDQGLSFEDPWHERIFVRLGWREKRFFVSAPISYSDSWHFETEAPPDLEVTTFQMAFFGQDGEPEPRRDESRQPRKHLWGSETGAGLLTIGLRARRDGFIRASFLLALLAFLLLLGGSFHLDALAPADQTQTVAAVLLLVPTLLAAYAVRPGEHRLASSIFVGVRVLVGLAALVPVAAVALLVAGYGDCEYLLDLWLLLLGASGLLLALLTVTYFKAAAPTPARV